jgi:hypothetical protein
MRREELTELHYITPIANLQSILKWGIYSHHRVEAARKKGLQSLSIALPEVQDTRSRVQVPNGRPLHEYANLYFCARNPMMFKRKEQHQAICIVRVATAVLDVEGTVITDQNAAAKFARFESAPDGLEIVDADLVFAEDWRHPGDELAYRRHRAAKCAEVLVPDRVPPQHLFGIFVSCEEARLAVAQTAASLKIEVNGKNFFV